MIHSFFRDIKGAIFDLDGTLVKSSHVWSDIDRRFLSRRGLAVPDDYYKAVSAMNFFAAAEYTNKRFELNESIEDIIAEWKSMALDEYANNIRLKEGAAEFLRELSGSGIKLALATAASSELYEAVLKSNGVYDMFEFFASTEQVERGKGFPDVYLLACEGLGLCPEECAVLEDIIEGIRGAKLGGFSAVACLDSHYIADWQDMKNEADIFFEAYRELLQ